MSVRVQQPELVTLLLFVVWIFWLLVVFFGAGKEMSRAHPPDRVMLDCKSRYAMPAAWALDLVNAA